MVNVNISQHFGLVNKTFFGYNRSSDKKNIFPLLGGLLKVFENQSVIKEIAMAILEETDWAELSMCVTIEEDRIVVLFSSPITHLSMGAEEARDFSVAISHIVDKLEKRREVH